MLLQNFFFDINPPQPTQYIKERSDEIYYFYFLFTSYCSLLFSIACKDEQSLKKQKTVPKDSSKAPVKKFQLQNAPFFSVAIGDKPLYQYSVMKINGGYFVYSGAIAYQAILMATFKKTVTVLETYKGIQMVSDRFQWRFSNNTDIHFEGINGRRGIIRFKNNKLDSVTINHKPIKVKAVMQYWVDDDAFGRHKTDTDILVWETGIMMQNKKVLPIKILSKDVFLFKPDFALDKKRKPKTHFVTELNEYIYMLHGPVGLYGLSLSGRFFPAFIVFKKGKLPQTYLQIKGIVISRANAAEVRSYQFYMSSAFTLFSGDFPIAFVLRDKEKKGICTKIYKKIFKHVQPLQKCIMVYDVNKRHWKPFIVYPDNKSELLDGRKRPFCDIRPENR